MRRPLRLAAVVVLCAAASALADRETALFSAKRADKALAAKKFDEAESLYRKALEEDATYLPAQYGLAQAFVGTGRNGLAIEELRKFIEAARADAALPADWKALVAKAEKQLADIDAAGATLQKIQDDYRDGLLALAQRWMAKDPEVAARALRRVLKMYPGNAKATELLGKMGLSASSEVIELFDGSTLGGWQAANSPIWQVVDGTIVADVRDSTYACRTVRMFEGNFDVHAEIKILEEYAGETCFELRTCLKSDYDCYALGVIGGKYWWHDSTGHEKKDRRDIVHLSPGQMRKSLNFKDWNTFELRHRSNEVTAFLNGEQMGKDPRPAGRQSGFVGLLVQCGKVAFRKIQVELR